MRGWSAMLVLMWSTVAAASHHHACRGKCAPLPLAAEITVGALQSSLSDRSFSGSGRQAGFDGGPIGPAQTLAAAGSALGLVKPIIVQAQLHYLWLTPWHLALGGTAGVLEGSGDRMPPDKLGGQTIGRSLSGMIVGPEVAAVFAHGPLELRASIAAGYRSMSVPVTSFAKVSCGKGGRCYPTLDDNQFFFEPRAVVALHFGSVSVGGYVGGDLTGGMGWSAGGLVGLALPEWQARAEVRPPSPPTP